MTDRSTGVAWSNRVRRSLSGIRVRVVVASITLLLLALTVSVFAIRQLLLVNLVERADREMTQEVDELRALAGGNDPTTGLPFGTDTAALFRTFLSRNVPAADEAFYTFVGETPHLTSFNAPERVFEDRQLIESWRRATDIVRGTAGAGDAELRYLVVPLHGSDDTVLGRFVVVIFPADDRAEVSQIVRTILVITLIVLCISSVAAWSVAGRVLRPVGALTRAARATRPNDLTTRIPVTGNDELAELGNTFNSMLDRLHDALQTQRTFLDDVAHELRTPITIVRGHLEMIDDDPDERRATVQLVTDELDRMARYVDDLLVVAKAAQPDFLRLELADIGELVDGALQRARGLGARQWVSSHSPPPGAVLTEIDVDRIMQAVLALASNAVQHTTECGVIEIGADTTDDEIRLWVRDDGAGVHPDDRERIFRRFSRGTAAARRPEGTGLGLAIVDAIARAHRGRIDLSSEPGRGATFTIVLPRTLLAADPSTEETP
jgi:two-component system OmpR family sensor kinase